MGLSVHLVAKGACLNRQADVALDSILQGITGLVSTRRLSSAECTTKEMRLV